MVKKLFFGISLAVGLGIFIVVIAKFGGVAKVVESIHSMGWVGMGVFLLNAALVLVVPAIGWCILLRSEGMKVPFWTTVKANMMGFPINFIAPSLFLGAEPLKMYYVSHLHDLPKRRILATVIVSKIQELGALILIMLGAAVITLLRIKMERGQAIFLMVGMAAICIFFGLCIYAFLGNWKPSERIINFIAGLGKKGMTRKRKFAKLRSHAREMEYIVRRFFTHHWKIFILTQVITMGSAISILIRPWIFFYYAHGVFLGMEILCAIYVVTNLINILPHTPGGLGIFEGGMVGLFSLLAIGNENAPAFAVVTRVSDIALILLGAWLIVHYNLQAVAKKVAKGDVKESGINPSVKAP